MKTKIILISIAVICLVILPIIVFAGFTVKTGNVTFVTDSDGLAVATLNGTISPDGHKVKAWIMVSFTPNKSYDNCKKLKNDGSHFAYGGNEFEGNDYIHFSVTGLKYSPVDPNEFYSYCAWAERSQTNYEYGEVKTFKPATAPPYIDPSLNNNPPAGYIKCADEGGQCAFDGTMDAAFGAYEHFNYKNNLTSFTCGREVFGDPFYGIAKACYLRPKGLPNYIFCAKEGGQCALPSKSKMIYGKSDIKFFTQENLTGTIACNNTSFGGDPAPGTNKFCFYSPNGPEGYTFCSIEGEVCSFDGVKDIAFGANEQFNIKTGVQGVIGCSSTDFGVDPVPGTKKACFKKNTSIFDSVATNPTSLEYKNDGTNVHTASNADLITNESAKLSGSAIPRLGSTSPTPVFGYFRYSPVSPESITPVFCNEVFGDDMKSTPEQRLDLNQNGTSVAVGARRTFSSPINNLDSNTTYYYCAVKSNNEAIEYGPVAHFTTANDPGVTLNSIETKPATLVSGNSAKLNGLYNTAVPAQTWFEYRKKRSYTDLVIGAIQEAQSKFTVSNLFSGYTLISNNLSATKNNNIDNIGTIQNSNQTVSKNGTNLLNSNLTYSSESTTATKLETNTNPYVWKKVDYATHAANTSGAMIYNLTGLANNTKYEFRAAIQTNINGGTPDITYGDTLPFVTFNTTVDDGDVQHDGDTYSERNISLGQSATPPSIALVGPQEGIETVLQRQIVADTGLQNMFSYQQGTSLETFAWDTAHFLAMSFGYVGQDKKEIRVTHANRAAYQVKLEGSKLTIYEYFDGKVVSIQNISSVLRGNYGYEYYFQKK